MTLRIQEDDEEYSLDQIKEFENVQHPNWNDILGAYDGSGIVNLIANAPSGFSGAFFHCIRCSTLYMCAPILR